MVGRSSVDKPLILVAVSICHCIGMHYCQVDIRVFVYGAISGDGHLSLPPIKGLLFEFVGLLL